MKTLAAGDHTLTVILSGAETSSNFTVPAKSGESDVSPQTGDDSHIEIWIIIMTISAAVAISLFLPGRKQRSFAE